jgi:Icc-related predicted phosphoesterase
MIRILTVSDVVEPRLKEPSGTRQFGDIDLIIISCGDLPPEYLSFLLDSMKVPLCYVSGNHDTRYEDKPPKGGLNLHGRLVPFKGINILGLEGSHWYNGGPYQYTEDQMRSVIRRLRPKLWWRGGLDMIVTHAPPRHIHDADDSCHRGFECYHRLIEKYQPRFFVHGHIHKTFNDPADRVTVVGMTKVVNTYGYNILEIENSPTAEQNGKHSTTGR